MITSKKERFMEQLHCSKQSVLLLARVRSGNRVSCNEFPVKGYGSEWQELAFWRPVEPISLFPAIRRRARPPCRSRTEKNVRTIKQPSAGRNTRSLQETTASAPSPPDSC